MSLVFNSMALVLAVETSRIRQKKYFDHSRSLTLTFVVVNNQSNLDKSAAQANSNFEIF